jgi:nucleoside-diphosphate-sugar epimerase
LSEDFVDDVNTLYHCAAELSDPELIEKVNILGTRNLIELSLKRVRRWVQLSSTGVYGQSRAGSIGEATPENPGNRYEASKLQADLLVQAAAAAGAFDYVIVRPSNVFGSEMTNQSLFQLVNAVQRGIFFFIGKKGASANYISVRNVVHAIVLCGTLEAAKNKTYIVSDTRSIEDFVSTIASELNVKQPSWRLPEFLALIFSMPGVLLRGYPLKPSRVKALTSTASYDAGRITAELGYQHVVSVEQELAALVAAYRDRMANSRFD